MILYTYTHMLKSVLHNSGSRQGQETTNSTCHEVMRVHKNEQVLTNKQWLLSCGSYFLSFSPVFLFPPPFFLLSFPSHFCLLPTHPHLFSSFLHFLPHLHLLFLLSSICFRLSYKGCTIKCECNIFTIPG